MSSDETRRFERLDQLFRELDELNRSQQEDRLARLERNEPELFPELRDLLHGTGGGLEDGVIPAAISGPDASETGAFDPRFRLVRVLGAGGMGEVWEAEQIEPLRRTVALKILQSRYGGDVGRARFQVESQALASMAHPHIARIFDADIGADGRPFFAMELVEGGESITSYCRRTGAGLRQRIELFLQACAAVDHAHSKRVIHRDLKPSNVLVAEENGTPVVKVIDFGIAKPLDADQAPEELATVVGEIVGTPEYMSPEQAALGSIDIDTRSDVYTLGVLLYELLVGELPIPTREARRLPFDELCRRIREDDTPKPSVLLRRSQTTRRSPPDSEAAPSTLGGTWRRVRGDLDRIVAKAMAKDRDHRYGSVAELADDLRRYLNHEPVRVAPPSWVYRSSKFVRRNRVLVASVAFLILGLGIGLAVALSNYQRALRAEEEALDQLNQVEFGERFLYSLFQGAAPEIALGRDLTALQLLERGAEQIESVEDPRVQGRLLRRLGEVHRSRGELDRAERLMEQAVERLEATADLEGLAGAHSRLGALMRNRGRYDEALEHSERALEIYAEADPSNPRVNATRNDIAITLNNLGRHQDAAVQYDLLIDALADDQEAPAMAVPATRFNAATNLGDMGDYDAAVEQIAAAGREMKAFLPSNHPNVATVHANLSKYLLRQGRVACAAEQTELGLAIDREVLPNGHPSLLESLTNGLRLANHLGRRQLAEDLWTEVAAQLAVSELDPRHDKVTSALDARVTMLFLESDFLGAVQVLADMATRAEESVGTSNLDLAGTWLRRAVALRSRALVVAEEPGAARDLATLVADARSAIVEAERHGAERESPVLEEAIAFQTLLLDATMDRALENPELRARTETWIERFLQDIESESDASAALDAPSRQWFRAQLPALIGRGEEAVALLRQTARRDPHAWLGAAPEWHIGRSGVDPVEILGETVVAEEPECPRI